MTIKIDKKTLAREWLYLAAVTVLAILLILGTVVFEGGSAPGSEVFFKVVVVFYAIVIFVRLTVWAIKNLRTKQ